MIGHDDPKGKLLLARRLAARALGVDELPENAEVECALDQEGTLHVRGQIIVDGWVPSIECTVRIETDDEPGPVSPNRSNGDG